LRSEFFRSHLRAKGHECDVFPAELPGGRPGNWEHETEAIARWLRRLPRPVGIMACYDIRGQQVLEACRRIGVAVPDEVAVIGVHNDDLLCDLCDPPLTSVIPNARRAGYEAAALLDRMMRGSTVPPLLISIEPIGVATRQSTDVVAVNDRQVSAAARFIRDHACEGLGVAEVLKAVPMSRTVLERRFKQLLGCTPHEHILNVRLGHVKTLLASTDLPLAQIAERTGFEHVEYLSVAFKRVTGLTPSAWRARHQT
jgi:LacI family transcriptional regulator